MSSSSPDPQSRTLNGWKEIAAHLGKSVRTVQRWETVLALPIRRIRTQDGQIVYANSDEIDRWRLSLDVPPESEQDDDAATDVGDDNAAASLEAIGTAPTQRSRTMSRRAAVLLAAVVGTAAFAAGVAWEQRPGGAAERFELTGRELRGLDSAGRNAWSHRFDTDVSWAEDSFKRAIEPWRIDLDGDNTVEALLAVRSSQPGAELFASDALYAFRPDGSIRWRVTVDHDVVYGGRHYTGPWRIERVVPSPTLPRRVWIAYSHHSWWPGFVVEVDAAGTSRVLFDHAGRIFTVNHWQTNAGEVLAAGGTSVDPAEPFVALLPLGGPPLAYSQSANPQYRCDSCPAAPPQRVYRFGQADLASASGANGFPYVTLFRNRGADLIVRLVEGNAQGIQGHSLVTMRPDFSISEWDLSDSYWQAHRSAERLGLLDHSDVQCPERSRARPVRVWTPANGWRNVAPTAAVDNAGGSP